MDLKENVGVPKAIGVRSHVTAQTFPHPDQHSCPLHSLYFQPPGMMILGGIIITYIMQQCLAQKSSKNAFTVSCYRDVNPGTFWGVEICPLRGWSLEGPPVSGSLPRGKQSDIVSESFKFAHPSCIFITKPLLCHKYVYYSSNHHNKHTGQIKSRKSPMGSFQKAPVFQEANLEPKISHLPSGYT